MNGTNEPKADNRMALVGPTQVVSNGPARNNEQWSPTKKVFVAGNIPVSAVREPSEVPVAVQPDSACATAYRLLARQIEHLGNTRRIVVTSPGKGEGKSFVALNLSLALATGGSSSVLLVEANFERPVIANRVGFTPPLGFGEWLRSAAEAPTRPFRGVGVCAPNLHVIAIDPANEAGAGLLGSGFEVAIRQLCFSQYQYIIVDGPQVMGSADCSIIADSMDGVVLCAAKGQTKVNDYKEAVKQLQPVPILAKVLLER